MSTITSIPECTVKYIKTRKDSGDDFIRRKITLLLQSVRLSEHDCEKKNSSYNRIIALVTPLEKIKSSNIVKSNDNKCSDK